MGNQSHLTPKLWDQKNLSQVPDRKCSCSRLTPGSSAMEFMAEVASKKGRGGGFLNTQKYVNICIYYIYICTLTFQWKPYVHVRCLFPIWTFFLMWHRCHLYGWCLSDSWSSELKCLHFDHLHPTPVAQTRFSSRQPKITVAPARAKAYEKGTKTSMTSSGMLRMSFSVPFWDLAIHVFLVVP